MKFAPVEEIFDEAYRERIGNPMQIATSAYSAMGGSASQWLKHGTTDMALVYSDGVIMVTDGRASSKDFHIATESFEKMFELDSHSLIAIAGVPMLGVPMADLLRARFSFEENDNEGIYVPPETKVNAISQSIRNNFPLAIAHQLVVEAILATYDLKKSRGGVFEIWADGTQKPSGADYVTIGSGSSTARVALKFGLYSLKKPPVELTRFEAVYLAISALAEAHEVDAGTGKNIFARSITVEGIERFSKEEIETIISRVNNGELIPEEES